MRRPFANVCALKHALPRQSRVASTASYSQQMPHGGVLQQGLVVQSASDQWFDEAYYQRYYFDKKTSVVDTQHVERLGTFVCSYLKYLRVPVKRVLDVGCGIGLWQGVLAQHFPDASYQGVEFSEYLCARYGWLRGSVVDFHSDQPFDLVICQGVLPYLSPADLQLALHNLGTLCRGRCM